ncbi:hypothetical protein ENSA5_46640 [Enhygromyxa salina]|uniref:Uncharacterized protein n=1 Tax=Enhygromyxa salina TaxID=215803 RepID=A0A2S9XJ12_9BACT|nr:hypothetical protein ENSA5_46640 [Enhygromyxa salina]
MVAQPEPVRVIVAPPVEPLPEDVAEDVAKEAAEGAVEPLVEDVAEGVDGDAWVDPTPTPPSPGVVEIGPAEVKIRPAHATQFCKTTRAKANAALKHGKWRKLESLTRESSCWKASWEARVLRMNAMFELGRLTECRRLGEGKDHEEIKKWVKVCSYPG